MQDCFLRRAGLIVASPALCIITGCAAVVLGLGAAAGTFVYVEGNLKKNYESGYDDSIRASTAALERLKIPLMNRTGDEAKTILSAKRANGTPVEIVIENGGKNQTEIGVRTGVVGVWDRQASMQIHEAITEQLQHTAAKGPPLQPVDRSKPEDTVPAPPEPASALKPEDKSPPKAPSAKTGDRAVTRQNQPAATLSDDLEEKGGSRIHFENGSIELTDAYRARLDRIAATMRADPAAAITLHGYSDAVGSRTDNFVVSAKRAQAVKAYLVSKGVNPEQIITLAHGATAFVATNRTEEGRQQNRRVEIEPHNFDLE